MMTMTANVAVTMDTHGIASIDNVQQQSHISIAVAIKFRTNYQTAAEILSAVLLSFWFVVANATLRGVLMSSSRRYKMVKATYGSGMASVISNLGPVVRKPNMSQICGGTE